MSPVGLGAPRAIRTHDHRIRRAAPRARSSGISGNPTVALRPKVDDTALSARTVTLSDDSKTIRQMAVRGRCTCQTDRDLDLRGVVEPALSRALMLAAEAGQWRWSVSWRASSRQDGGRQGRANSRDRSPLALHDLRGRERRSVAPSGSAGCPTTSRVRAGRGELRQGQYREDDGIDDRSGRRARALVPVPPPLGPPRLRRRRLSWLASPCPRLHSARGHQSEPNQKEFGIRAHRTSIRVSQVDDHMPWERVPSFG